MNVCEKYKLLNMVQKKPKSTFLIAKRNNQFENEVQEIKKTPTRLSPEIFGDRFIPRRYALETNKKNEKLLSSDGHKKKDILMLCSCSLNYWRPNNFILALNKIFDIRDLRVLQLSSESKTYLNRKTDSYKFVNLSGDDWTCRPRTKPLAFTESTHDLPGFNSSCDLNLVDWSVNDQIVASFGRDIILWERSHDITLVFQVNKPRCLAYSPNGELLAVGFKTFRHPVLELWDVTCINNIEVKNGFVFGHKQFSLECIEWSKKGDYIICGTYFGTIYVLSAPELDVIHKTHECNKPITTIKFSPTMRYFVSADNEGSLTIYKWKSFKAYTKVKFSRKGKITLDWHPWNGVDLLMSEQMPASIIILHVPSKQIVAQYYRIDKKIVINSVTFSKLTAELVVSISNRDLSGCVDCKVLVMSSLDHVVDMLKIPNCNSRFVIWSPDGTKLATAGDNETLTIWNFHPFKCVQAYKAEEKNQISYKTLKTEQKLDADYGAQFKMWSCLK